MAYTYSKCIDDGSISTGLEAGNDPAQTQSNPYDLNADRGRCDFDVKYSFVGNAVYMLPSAGNVLTKGWQLSGIVTAHSGTPFTVIDGFDQVDLGDAAGDEGNAERPNLVAGKSGNPVTGNPNSWYNGGSFALQPAGTIGDLSRNTLVAPKYVDIDASLAKNTRIWERTNLQLQVEGFNLFNHPNFGLPNQTLYTGVAANGSGIPNPLAGQIVNTVGTSREIQLALKFEF